MRCPTISLSDGMYMTPPVATISSTAVATDQWRIFSVAEAGVRVIAPRLPVASVGGLNGCDPPQPLDALVSVVERHHQPGWCTAFGSNGCAGHAKGNDHLESSRNRKIKEVNVGSIR